MHGVETAVGKLAPTHAPRRLGCVQNTAWTLRGTVVPGDQRGRLLGFPTANIGLVGHELPSFGVYVGLLDGMAAAASIGVRPTFGENVHPLLEVHVLDFNGDLYGRQVTVTLIERLRDELTFDSVDELVAQIERDVQAVRARLG